LVPLRGVGDVVGLSDMNNFERIFLIVALIVRLHGTAEGATKSFGDSQEPFSKGS
jgi:hypothetical protein